MLVISCASKLQALETQLVKHFPESLKVYGALKTIIRGNPFRDEVVVDSWPEFRAVITRPQKKYLLDPYNYHKNAYSVFYRDLGVYRDLLESIDVVNNTHTFEVQGNQEGVCETSLALADGRGINVKILPFLTVQHLDPMSLKDFRLKSGQSLKLSALEEHHANQLNRMWAYGGTEKSRIYLKDLVLEFPSCGIEDEEGNLITWALTDQFGTISHCFTMPGHRQKGYNSLMIATLGRKLHHLGFPLQGSVLQENVPMKNMLKHIGFTFMPCPHFEVVHTPTLSTMSTK